MARSKMDPIQIAQMTFAEDVEAVRVQMLPTEMSMELSADDGDSVMSVPKMQVIECKVGDVVDTTHAKRASSTEPVNIKAVILEQELDHGQLSMTPRELCVPAIKVEADCVLILQS